MLGSSCEALLGKGFLTELGMVQLGVYQCSHLLCILFSCL